MIGREIDTAGHGLVADRPLDGRAALVTGASAGIGEATALALATAGASVVVAGRDRARGAAVADAITTIGGEACFVVADVRSTAAVDAMVGAAVDRFGRLDIAFNNAGIFDRGHELHEYGDDPWDDMIAVNLSGVFRCIRAEISAMLDSGGGSIINNASTVGHRGSVRASPAYVAAKHGVIGLTRQAAVQYIDRGIRVNAVSPGPTETEVAAPLLTQDPKTVGAVVAGLNPTGMLVSPEEIARTVVFLASDAATMINGHAIPLDGGQLAAL